MQKVFINLFFIALAALQLNCAGKTANDSNAANANEQTATAPTVEADQNANVTAQETPMLTFTDAGEAMAEGDKLFDANENEKAIEAYSQAVKLNPDLADAYFKLGIAYALLESERETSAEPSAEATPTPKPTRAKKGKKDAPLITTDSDKAFDSAVKAYQRILEKNPKDDAAQYNLGRSYNKLNQDKEAEKALREAVKLKPEDGDYQTELGSILIKLAHYEAAVGALKKALKIDENNSIAQELLKKAEAGRKRVDFGVNKLKQQQQQQMQQQMQQLQNRQ